jgi:hypothetical protein
MKTIRATNWKVLWKSAWHVFVGFAVAVMGGGFYALPIWLRIGYSAALAATWILLYKIETAWGAWRAKRRARKNSTPVKAEIVSAARPIPADSDSAIDAEESAVYALMNVGYSRAQAAKIARSAPAAKDPAWVVNFDDHSSRARA